MASNTGESIRSMGAVEHAQTLIIDENLSYHKKIRPSRPVRPMKRSQSYHLSEKTPLIPKNSSIPNILEYKDLEEGDSYKTIRFQVVVWYVGKVDVVEGRVPVTFRLTIFWNDQGSDEDMNDMNDTDTVSTRSSLVWSMRGRQHAIQKELKDIPVKEIPVPPVSILNTSTFDTIGSAEVAMLNEETRLMRWTCMYRATLIQDSFTVEDFPHDSHEISIKLAILAHRNPGQQWDRSIWKLALATDDDSQGTTRIPHGLIVDQVEIPGFSFHKERGLDFTIDTLDHGPAGQHDLKDEYLEVSLSVLRQSGYYDNNIMPLIAFLNLVAVSILCLPPDQFFQRGLLTLQITFVEIGIRMTTDSHLPSVEYQIKIQRLLNEYFYGLLLLVLESMIVFELYEDLSWSKENTTFIDWAAGILSLAHNMYSLYTYYMDAHLARIKLLGKKQ